MKLSVQQLRSNLLQLGLAMEMETGLLKPVSYSVFKNRATTITYGVKRKGVFIGIPNENLFGFFTSSNDDIEVMKEAYEMYCRLVKGYVSDYEDGLIQWGYGGIPKFGKMSKSLIKA